MTRPSPAPPPKLVCCPTCQSLLPLRRTHLRTVLAVTAHALGPRCRPVRPVHVPFTVWLVLAVAGLMALTAAAWLLHAGAAVTAVAVGAYVAATAVWGGRSLWRAARRLGAGR